jgi:ABC-type transport system involved in Fe-S cluster assembly fused permease/ATPase subunit
MSIYQDTRTIIYKNAKLVSLALGLLLLSKIFIIGIPFILKELIDRLTKDQVSNFSEISPYILVLCYASVSFGSVFFNEIKEIVSTKISSGLTHEISRNVFKKILNTGLNFHIKNKTGILTKDVERGIRGLQLATGLLVHTIVPTIVEITFVGFYFLYAYNYAFVAIMISTLIVYIAFTIIGTNSWAKFRVQINKSDSDASQKFIESIVNIETIKYFNKESFELKAYDANLKINHDSMVNSQKYHSKLVTGQQLIISTGIACILWKSITDVYSGIITIGDVVLINTLMIQIYSPISFLGIIYKDFKQSAVDIKRLNEIYTEEIQDSSKTEVVEKINKEAHQKITIKLKDIEFNYPNRDTIIKSLNLEFKHGTKTALVGRSGAGKSTIIRILCHLHKFNSGDIFLNNTNTKSLSEHEIRSLISIIPQEISLFSESIYYNISYGSENATFSSVVSAAKNAQIHDYIMSLEKGYDTHIGERGVTLSGGEKQRLAIARALVRDAPIIIFDEATSSLDSHTESAFQNVLSDHLKDKTTLIVAHRLSTIINCDNIIFLEDGSIKESGTHIELIHQKGAYYELWMNQTSEYHEA